ncbi:Uncharacterised protein [Mycobacteroides abscessus subsp. abscessus]|nr:Uncharacterised protein [Mycobacteroides abscessus subsp. abscessus]
MSSTPITFTSSIRRHSSRSASSNGAASIAPALATTRSGAPMRSVTSSNAAATARGSLTSVAMARPSNSSATSVSLSIRRPSSATRAPRAASVLAVAAPIPVPAPVTTAMRPSRVAVFSCCVSASCGSACFVLASCVIATRIERLGRHEQTAS